jgi:ribosomal-protein-serine acetyltransferase
LPEKLSEALQRIANRKGVALWPLTITADASLVLELINRRHAPEIFRLVDKNRDYLGRWLPWVAENTDHSHTASFVRRAEEGARKNTEVHYVIRYNQQLVGILGFAKIDRTSQVGMLGFWLGQEWQGLGFMTRACKELIREAFVGQHLLFVEIRCGIENKRSRAIPERLRFQLVGVSKDAEIVQSKSIDHAVYSVSRDAFLCSFQDS